MSAPHLIANRVLGHLKTQHVTVNTKAIVDNTRLTTNEVKNALDFLQQNGYIESPRYRAWKLTSKGHAVGAEGVQKHATPRAQTLTPTAVHLAGATGIRGKAWRAICIKNSVTLDDVCSLIDDGTEPNVRVRIAHYFNPLVSCGVLGRTKHGTASVYILLQYLGPFGPTVSRRGHIFDPNAKKWLAGGPEQ